VDRIAFPFLTDMKPAMKTIQKTIALSALSVFLCGCADTVKPPITARQDPYQREQVHITSMDLRRSTAVDAPIVSRDDGGLIHVQVPIRAATDKKLYVDYRVTFFDRNGQALNQTGWLHKTLTPNTPDQISFNSTTPLASDFQMDVRYSE
jgi:hypothetical protein